MTIPSCPPSEKHPQNSLTKRNFKAGSWIAVDQEIEATSSLKDPHQSKIDYGKRFLWLWRIGFDDGGGIGMMLRYCLFDLRITVHRDVAKGRKNLTPSGRLKNVFSRRQLGLVQEETLVVFYTRMPQETVRTTWNEVEIRKNSHLQASILFQYRKWKTQTDGKSLNSLMASTVTKAENSLSMVGKMKNIVVWFSTSSRISWLQVWKQMHPWLLLLMSTSWRWEGTSARGRKEEDTHEKKGPRLCISKLRSNEFYSTESWSIGIERFGGTHMQFSGCTWYIIESGKEKGNLEALSKKVNFMSEILARPVLRNNHLRKPHDKQIVSAK